jgi:transposase-like protein
MLGYDNALDAQSQTFADALIVMAGPAQLTAESHFAVGLLYTTNAIEALNSKLRRAVRARGHFPTDEAALKLLFLVLNRAEKEWKMPPREWAMAKAQFAVIFGDRFKRAMAA